MQNVLSYGKPKDIRDLFEEKSYDLDVHFLRYCTSFQIPLVRSIKLSSSPIYVFPSTFNKFPHPFKEIVERRIFLEKLDEHYVKYFENDNCKKKYCKFCNAKLYYERLKSFYSSPKTYEYFKYNFHG